MPSTNATRDRSFFAIKLSKILLRNFTTKNRLNHFIMLHVNCEKNDQPNLEEVAKDFKGDN